MRDAYALRLGVAASLVLAVAGCGPALDERSEQLSAVKKPDPCLAAQTIEPGLGMLTLAGDSTDAANRPVICAGVEALPIHRPTYFAFTVEKWSALYVDALGSSFDTLVGVVAGGCGGRAGRCADDGCGTAQSKTMQVLAPGAYHLVVGGKEADDRGPFTVHVQLVPLSELAKALGLPGTPASAEPIPRGDFELVGSLSSQGGWLGDCGRGWFTWYWYLSCPGAPGYFTASTANAETEFEATLSFVDVDDGVEICCDADVDAGPNVACMGDGLEEFPREAALTVWDESEAGLHILKVGVAGVMSVPTGQYRVVGYRP